jgi:hypothetical protein
MVTFAHRATQQGSSVEHAQNGFLAKIKNLTLGEKNYWTLTSTAWLSRLKNVGIRFGVSFGRILSGQPTFDGKKWMSS